MDVECSPFSRWRKQPQKSNEEFNNSLQLCQRKFRHYLANIYILNHCALKIQHWFFSKYHLFPRIRLETHKSREVKLSDSPIYDPNDQFAQQRILQPLQQNNIDFQAPSKGKEMQISYGKENIESSKDRPQKPCQSILTAKPLNMASIQYGKKESSGNTTHYPLQVRRMQIDLVPTEKKRTSKVNKARKASPILNTSHRITKNLPNFKYCPRTRSPLSNIEILHPIKNLKAGLGIESMLTQRGPKQDSRKPITSKITEIVTKKVPCTARSLSPRQRLNAVISKNTKKSQKILADKQMESKIANQTTFPEKVASNSVLTEGLKKVRRRRDERNRSKNHNYCVSEQISLESILNLNDSARSNRDTPTKRRANKRSNTRYQLQQEFDFFQK